jgi:hypothetical protein
MEGRVAGGPPFACVSLHRGLGESGSGDLVKGRGEAHDGLGVATVEAPSREELV